MSIAAVIQMTSTAIVRENLDAAEELLREAARAGAVLAALPENFALMGLKDEDKFAAAEVDGRGIIQDWLAATARALNLWIVAGTIPITLPGESRVVAANLVIDAQGERRARYDKIHLFDVDIPQRAERYRESATIAPGHTPVVVDTPIGRLGLAVCYDVRFPELFRILAAQGAQLLSLPSAFTVPTGEAHWNVLLRARAIENLCFLLAPAQSGTHASGRATYGHSIIVDPWGTELASRTQGPGVVLAEIDLSMSQATRTRFPALAHRRL
jgi:nitrilase